MTTQVGPKGSDRYFKYLEPQKDVVTKKNYDKARENWLKEKSKSNEQAQKIMRNTLNKRTMELSHLIGKVLLELKEET